MITKMDHRGILLGDPDQRYGERGLWDCSPTSAVNGMTAVTFASQLVARGEVWQESAIEKFQTICSQGKCEI